MAVLAALNARVNFTETDRRLAEHILAHVDEVPHQSIDALARASFTSSAAVVRLCKKCGASGFRDFCVQLTADLERDRMARHHVDADAPFVEGQGVPEVTSNIAALYRRAVDDCAQTMSNSAIYGAARAISKASRVFYLAMGESALIADCFACELAKIGILAVSVERRGDWTTVTSLAGPDDVFLVVSYSGNILRDSSLHATEMQRFGCKTVLITGNAEMATDAPGFDHRIAIPDSESGWGRVSSFYSQTSVRYALDCLYGAVYSFNYAQSKRRRDELERFTWTNYSGKS